VRYADDLVALARTEGEARSALNAMASALRPLGLELNRALDPVRSFDAGYEFLGFGLRGNSVRVAPSKLLEFRRHALRVLEDPAAGSMRRRIALLNRMIRGWRAYYRAGVPREQFEELDAWLQEQVRAARLRVWAQEGPGRRSLELAGLESLARPGRRIFQPEPPPTVEGYAYRIPLEGEAEHDRVAVLRPLDTLRVVDGACTIVRGDGTSVPLDADTRAVVTVGGVTCASAALRRLLERGVALRFVGSADSG
jgi:hypothetical protein